MVTNNEQPDIQADFDAFWTLYPRKVAKKDARRAWAHISPREYAEILTALAVWRRVWAQRGEPDFVPYPATWLNGERWTDALPTGFSTRPPTSSVAEAKPEVFTRDEMPAHVKALIQKLRGAQ